MTTEIGDYIAELLVLASVVLIWVPAYKLVKLLRAGKKLSDVADRTRSTRLRQFALDAAQGAEQATKEFDALDLLMLRAGIFCAVASSLMKVFWLIPATHH